MNLIQPYNPNWKIEFEHLKNTLNTKLRDFEIDIQHVGSTSIPELYAKPILDIDIIIEDKNLIGKIATSLEDLGYKNRGEQGIIGRFAFRQSSEFTPLTELNKKWQEYHLYVCFSDSLALKNHLLFRDTLLKNRKLVEEYSLLKQSLVKQENMTKEKYSKLKTDFILEILLLNGLDEEEVNEIRKANT